MSKNQKRWKQNNQNQSIAISTTFYTNTTATMSESEEKPKIESEPEVKQSSPSSEPSKKKSPKREKAEKEAEKASKKMKAKPIKKMSKLERKKNDDRFFLNGKGRYVSKKKHANGKTNVQSRAMKMGRKLLGLEGKMCLLGRGAEGRALLKLCKSIREALKEGKKDDDVSILHEEIAKHMLEAEKKEEGGEEKK